MAHTYSAILEYAVETWGTVRWPEAERVQLELGRMILGVAWKTASDVVRGELGLWTMSGRFKLAVLRWWGKLVKMDRNRLCYKIYNYRRNHLREKGCWCKIVRDLLIDLNIGDIWISEEIGDLTAWGENVKSRVSAWEARSWKERILGKPKLRVYRLLKTDLKFEEYLLEVPIYLHRRELSRFRGGTNDLRVETGRYSKEEVAERSCCICAKGVLENEEHVLLDCFPYEPLRRKMFATICYQTDLYELSMMRDDRKWMLDTLLGHSLSNKKHRCIVRVAVARFLYKAMKWRRRWLS